MGLRWVQLDADERDEFLGDGGTGVISFATAVDEPPLSLPVSYGYLDDPACFYFRLAFPPQSRKRDAVGRPTTFVTQERTGAGWRSVVATGELEPIDDAPYESAAVQGLWGVRIPSIDVFDRPREDIEFHDFRLVPDTITGRKEVTRD